MMMTATVQAADTKADLKAKFEQRYPQLHQAKKDGKVGENWQGFVEAVEAKFAGDAKIADLIEQENADRKKLYALIAEEQSKDRKVSPAQVAERNARRNFSEAKDHEFLRTKDNVWMQRKEVRDLKKRGIIGETWEGYVEVVDGANADAQAKAVLAEENRMRKDAYLIESKKKKSTPEKVAQQAGSEAIESAGAGEQVKGKDGKWVKK
jgi:uncharacterized protein YdbL (DUF1318 family)